VNDVRNSEILILRKTLYGETSVIIAGISPEMGRLDLIIKGGMEVAKSKLPAVDIFRKLNVEFSMSRNSTIHNLKYFELISSYGEELANIPDNYATATELAALVLNWIRPELPVPETYYAALNVFDELCQIIPADRLAEAKRTRCSAMLKITILSENGILPEVLDDDPDLNVDKHDIIDQILAAAQGLDEPPKKTARFWQEMSRWADLLLRNSETSL